MATSDEDKADEADQGDWGSWTANRDKADEAGKAGSTQLASLTERFTPFTPFTNFSDRLRCTKEVPPITPKPSLRLWQEAFRAKGATVFDKDGDASQDTLKESVADNVNAFDDACAE